MGLNITETMDMVLRRLNTIFLRARCLLEAKNIEDRVDLEIQYDNDDGCSSALAAAIETGIKIAEKNLDDLKWRITMLEDKLERFENGEEE